MPACATNVPDRGNGRRPEVAMDWVWYLFGFEGRINCAKYWVAGLIIGCWMLFLAVLTLGLAAIVQPPGTSEFNFGVDDVFKAFDPASYRSISFAELPFVVLKVAGSAVFLWVYLATSVKRLHDRDKSGWWMVPLFFLPGLYGQFADRLPDSYFVLLPAMVAFVFCIWNFVELYCLKGSRKTNRFGADPLAPSDMRPRWEQQSEIEMVPHKAGPPPVWRVKPGYE
jgi:uncharacterized membrane protein YhaH (DUF805 family)